MQIEGCRSRFHRKGRKDNVTLIFRSFRPLRCIISYKLYFNSNYNTPTAHHFPTHALSMKTHTRSAAPEMGGRSRPRGAAQMSGEWRATGEGKKGWGQGSILLLTTDEYR